MLINRFILKSKNPLKSGLWSLPIFYGVTLFVNLFSIIHDGPKCEKKKFEIHRVQALICLLSKLVLHMDNIPTYVAVIIASVTSLVVAILVQVIIVPWQRKKILGESQNGQPVKFTFGDSDGSFNINLFYFSIFNLNSLYRFIS